MSDTPTKGVYNLDQETALEGLVDDFRAVWRFVHQGLDADDDITGKHAAVRVLWLLSDHVDSTLAKHFPERVEDGRVWL